MCQTTHNLKDEDHERTPNETISSYSAREVINNNNFVIAKNYE